MDATVARHAGLRRYSPIALGTAIGCLLGLLFLSGPPVEARVAALSQCGGIGQRACCGLENLSIGACQNGLVEVPGCVGDCKCPGIGDSAGTCAPKAPCGAEGQRACNTLGVQTCNPGLTAVPGCSGNCFASSADLDPAADILGTSTHT